MGLRSAPHWAEQSKRHYFWRSWLPKGSRSYSTSDQKEATESNWEACIRFTKVMRHIAVLMAGWSMTDKDMEDWCCWFERYLAGSFTGNDAQVVADSIDFSDNRLTSAGVHRLLQTLTCCNIVVRVLKLHHNRLQDGTDVAEFIGTCAGTLQELHLSHNSLSTEAATKIVLAAASATDANGTLLYPRPMQQGGSATPLWLRMEWNYVDNQRLLERAQKTLEEAGLSSRVLCSARGAGCTPHCCTRHRDGPPPIHAKCMANQRCPVEDADVAGDLVVDSSQVARSIESHLVQKQTEVVIKTDSCGDNRCTTFNVSQPSCESLASKAPTGHAQDTCAVVDFSPSSAAPCPSASNGSKNTADVSGPTNFTSASHSRDFLLTIRNGMGNDVEPGNSLIKQIIVPDFTSGELNEDDGHSDSQVQNVGRVSNNPQDASQEDTSPKVSCCRQSRSGPEAFVKQLKAPSIDEKMRTERRHVHQPNEARRSRTQLQGCGALPAAECEQLLSILQKSPSKSIQLESLREQAPKPLEHLLKDPTLFCSGLRRWNGLIRISGDPGAEVVTLSSAHTCEADGYPKAFCFNPQAPEFVPSGGLPYNHRPEIAAFSPSAGCPSMGPSMCGRTMHREELELANEEEKLLGTQLFMAIIGEPEPHSARTSVGTEQDTAETDEEEEKTAARAMQQTSSFTL